MGRGRTTTGLIIACLWSIHRGKIRDYDSWLNLDTKKHGLARAASVTQRAAGTTTGFNNNAATSTSSPSPIATSSTSAFVATSTSLAYAEPSNITGDDENSEKQRQEEFANGRKHGWYKVIQSLVRVLPDGPNIKRQVDRVIDQ